MLVLLFPLLDIIILRVTWFYRDDLFLPNQAERVGTHTQPSRARESYFSRSFSSYSTPNRTIHPLASTQATIVFSNDREEYPDEQMKREDSIVYGNRHHSPTEDTDTSATSPTQRRHERDTAVQIDSLPAIESPSLRELSARRKNERAMGGDTFVNTSADTAAKLTRVLPIKPALLPPLLPPRSCHQSTHLLEKLADTSLLYQDNYEVAYGDSRTELIETYSTPQLGDGRLLKRPDNVRRKISKTNPADL